MKKNKIKYILCLLPLIIFVCNCFVLQHNTSMIFNNDLFVSIFNDLFNIGNGDFISNSIINISNSAFNCDMSLIALYISYLVYLQFIYLCYDLIIFLPKNIEKLINKGCDI